MMKRRWGRIINIASIVGITGNKGQANYAASKAGLIGLTKSVAKELGARNILVNCDRARLHRDGHDQRLDAEAAHGAYWRRFPSVGLAPRDVAAMIVFLASEHAAYITGQVMVVDGGMVM